jgi:hypothetical protein
MINNPASVLSRLLYKGLLAITVITLVNCNQRYQETHNTSNSEFKAFKEISTDVNRSLHKRITHITKIKFDHKGHGYRFTGVHSKIAIDNAHGKARVEIVTPPNTAGVYEAKVFATAPDGIEITKTGNGGKSTFFPDNWDESKILEETEFAIKNNKGFENGIDDADGYYGYSKDGKVRIGFYYRNGAIISFFPTLRK